MFCKQCGTQIKEGVKFCGNCGTKVAENTTGTQVSINDSADVGAYSMQEIAAKHHNTQQNIPKTMPTPTAGQAPPRQQYTCTPPGKKASLFKFFLIVIPLQYILCFTLVAFHYDGLSEMVFSDYYSRGTPLWQIPMSQVALFQITFFLIIYGPSSILLFFIMKHCLKRQKKTAFGFSIPLALYYIALICISLITSGTGFYDYANFFYQYAARDLVLFFPGIITFYPFIPPLLTLIRFEGSEPRSASVRMPPPPAGMFGGITSEQMRANTMEGLTDSVLREIHEGYKNPVPPTAAKKPPVPLIIAVSVAVIAAAAIFLLGRDNRAVTTNNTSANRQTDATQSGVSRILRSTDDGLPVANVKNELYRLCDKYRYYHCFFFDGKSGFINALGSNWEWVYDINRVLIYAEEFESSSGRMVNVYGIESGYARLVQFSNTQTGNRDSRDKSDLDTWIAMFELEALIQGF
jgi:hypothetical protein